jgi:hypothetical protein
MADGIYLEIANYLLSNPKSFVAYTDSGEWAIYASKPKGLDTGDISAKPVYEGHDDNGGYLPTLVEIMGIALKVRTWSI